MKKNIVIVTLIAVILILGGSLLYLNMNKDKIGCKSACQKPKAEAQYTVDNIKGLYIFNSDPVHSEEADSDVTIAYQLYLYEDGTFNYSLTQPYGGHIGNYTVKNNSIVLNYMFDTSSDTSLEHSSKTKVLTISENGSLIDSENEVSIVKSSKITLNKASNEEEKAFLNNHDSVNKMLTDYKVTSKIN